MRALIILLLFMASAQAAPVTLTLDDQEKALLAQMCQLARWASRAQMENVCEHFQKKVAEAEQQKLGSKDKE